MFWKNGIALAAILAVAATGALASDAEFDATWHDGKAEIDGYRLIASRYGQDREGTCVMIYVTEPFSESKRVKVDDHTKNPSDVFNALKLNLVRDFQTGIYDYNTMVSVFVRTSDFSPVKLSFTSAEWCGHVYEELLFEPKRVQGHYYSYFENESGPRRVTSPEDGVAEDNLFILLRGLRDDFLAPGATRKTKMLRSVYAGRLSHKPLEWIDLEITRDKDTETVEVAAGRFEAIVYRLEAGDGRDGVFYIESAYPHRIVQWRWLPDVRAELTGSKRLAYWRLNKNGDESYLKELLP